MMGGQIPECLIVVYHGVRDRPHPLLPGAAGLTRCDFEAQVRALARRYEFIREDEYLAYLRGEGDIPPRSCILTFDDGTVDHTDVVFPVLRRLGVPGLFLICSGPYDGKRVLAVHKIHILNAILGPERFRALLEEEIAALHPGTSLGSWVRDDEMGRIYHYEPDETTRVIKYTMTFSLPLPVRDEVLSRIFARTVGDEGDAWDGLYPPLEAWRSLEAEGMTVGGQGHRHDLYRRLTPAEQDDDIRRCSRMLHALLGSRARSYTCPYGSPTPEAFPLLRRHGFIAHYTGAVGRVNQARVDPFRIERVDANDISISVPVG